MKITLKFVKEILQKENPDTSITSESFSLIKSLMEPFVNFTLDEIGEFIESHNANNIKQEIDDIALKIEKDNPKYKEFKIIELQKKGVIEHLIFKILDLSAIVARDYIREKITPLHIWISIMTKNNELTNLFPKQILPMVNELKEGSIKPIKKDINWAITHRALKSKDNTLKIKVSSDVAEVIYNILCEASNVYNTPELCKERLIQFDEEGKHIKNIHQGLLYKIVGKFEDMHKKHNSRITLGILSEIIESMLDKYFDFLVK